MSNFAIGSSTWISVQSQSYRLSLQTVHVLLVAVNATQNNHAEIAVECIGDVEAEISVSRGVADAFTYTIPNINPR